MARKRKYKYPRNKGGIKFEKYLLPEGATNIIGDQNPTHIVIHEVWEGTKDAPKEKNIDYYKDAIFENAKIQEEDYKRFEIGYHYIVDEKSVYQFIPDNKATCHTGTKHGNRRSIGVERIICKGNNHYKSIHNQAELIATLMLKHNIPLENVITHKEMQIQYGNDKKRENPKKCPGRLLAGYRGTVQSFKQEIEKCFINGWFIKEMLDEKMIEQIPEVQKVAKMRQQREQAIKKAKRGRTVTMEELKKLNDDGWFER